MPFCLFLLANISLAEDQILSHDKKYIGVKDNNIYIYKGIRYAQPPLNQNRWNSPQDIENEEYPIQATKFGNACMQTNRLTIWSKQNVFINGGDVNKVVDDLTFDEDCLFLNVWTPVNEENKKLSNLKVWMLNPVQQ